MEKKEGREEKKVEVMEEEDGDGGVEIVMGTPLPPPAPMLDIYRVAAERLQDVVSDEAKEESGEEKNGHEGASEWASSRRSARSRAPTHPRVPKLAARRVDQAENEEDLNDELKRTELQAASTNHENKASSIASITVQDFDDVGDDIESGMLSPSESKLDSEEAASALPSTPNVNYNHQEPSRCKASPEDLEIQSTEHKTEASDKAETIPGGKTKSNMPQPPEAQHHVLESAPTSVVISANDATASANAPIEQSEWISCTSESGHVYYYNQITHECRWQLPQEIYRSDPDVFTVIFSPDQLKYLENALLGGLDPNITDEDGSTLLYHAVQAGNELAIELLITYGAEIDRSSSSDVMTPLLLACRLGKLQLFKMLFECGGSLSSRDSFGNSAVHLTICSANNELLEAVLDAAQRASILLINWQNSDGETALHFAAQLSNPEAVRSLLRRGADVRVENSHGQTPVVVGVLANSVECVQLLQEMEFSQSSESIVVSPSTSTLAAETLSEEVSDVDKLLSAIIPKPEGCDYEVLEALRSFVDETQQAINALEEQLKDKKRNEKKYSDQMLSLSASLRGANEEVQKEKQFRIELEAKAMDKAAQFQTLQTLQLATATRCSMLESVARDAYAKLKKERGDRAKSEEVLYQKLQQSLDQNASLMASLQALQISAAPIVSNNNATSVPYEYESSSSAYSKRESLPGPEQVQLSGNNQRTYASNDPTQYHTSILSPPARKRNSKHNVKWGEVRSGDIATPINTSDVTPPVPNSPPPILPPPPAPSSPSRIQAVWNRFYENMDSAGVPSSSISRTVHANASLFDPIRRSDLHTLQRLLLSGCSPNQRDSGEKGTPLHLACELGDLDAVMMLCEFAADLEARDEDDNTPLLASCIQGNYECTKFLLQSAASLNVVNKNSETALHVAAWDGSAECVAILLEYGIDTSLTNSFGLTALRNLKTRSPLRHKFDDMGLDHPIIQTIQILENYESDDTSELDSSGAGEKVKEATIVAPVMQPSSQTQSLNSTWKSWLFGFGGASPSDPQDSEEKNADVHEEADSNGEEDSMSSYDDADLDTSFQPVPLKPLTPPPEIQEVLRRAKQQQ